MYWAAIINFGSFIIMFLFMEEVWLNCLAVVIDLLLSLGQTNFVRTNSEASEAKHLSSGDDKAEKSSSASVPGELVGTPKTTLQRLKLFDGRYASNKMLFTMAYRPVVLLRFPVIFWQVWSLVKTLQ